MSIKEKLCDFIDEIYSVLALVEPGPIEYKGYCNLFIGPFETSRLANRKIFWHWKLLKVKLIYINTGFYGKFYIRAEHISGILEHCEILEVIKWQN